MIIDKLSNSELYINIAQGITLALKYLQQTDINSLETGRYDIDGDNIYALVNDYETKDRAKGNLESHKKYIDVQYMAKGNELIGFRTLNDEQPLKIYDEEKDFMLFDEEPVFLELNIGMFAVFFPGDLHMPGIAAHTKQKVRKVVVKVKCY